jgi:predicted nuclease with TOPRIM domain
MEKDEEYYANLDKRTKEYKEWKERFEEAQEEQPKGLGDTIERIAKVTGIKKAVEFIAGEDCGCDERKTKLNEYFPYNKAECLTEEEYHYLKDFYSKNRVSISPAQQQELIKIYNRVLHYNQEMTNCASCFKEVFKRLEKIINIYK